MVLATGLGGLALLLLLACPVSMGLMMWFMGRGMSGHKRGDSTGRAESLAELKAEQARLAAKIDSLEAPDPEPKTRAPEPTQAA